ncbi:MAG TPA: hypothetical protein VG297_24915 [Bryobacteraceae bacterium]|nr:hypothetical protein [Bryobacteraceae bacterium]
MRTLLTAVCLLAAGCAAHKPVSVDWRFIGKDTAATLIPPGVAGADVMQRILTTDIAAGKGPCPGEIRVRKNHVVATVNRGALDGKPDGWLTAWAADAESQGCIAAGEAPKLAARVAESLPLDPQKAFHVLYPDDLVPPVRLQMVSPILRDESKPVLNDEQVSGNGNQLTLSVRADNLIGYETAVYTVQPKASGAGYAIAPLYADKHVGNTTERREQPATNYFHFPAEAAFFRLFVKSGQTDYTALAIAASTRAELAQLAAALEAGTTSCETLGPKSCIAIPRRVALNPVVPATINGSEMLVRWSADLAEAIRTAGERRPESLLATLTISRLYAGRPTPVDFDRSNPAILRLPITGGEIISWKR